MKFVNFLKSRLILLFLNVCKQIFHISHVRISQKVKSYNMKSSAYLCSYEDKNIDLHRSTFKQVSADHCGVGACPLV